MINYVHIVYNIMSPTKQIQRSKIESYQKFALFLMSVLYIHINGFVIPDKKNDTSSSMFFTITHDRNGAMKQFSFRGADCANIKKSFNMKITGENETLTINLYKKHIFSNELIGTLTIPVCEIEANTKSLNVLELTNKNDKSESPILLRCVIHLSSDKSLAYNCPKALPKLPQYDLNKSQQLKSERIALTATMNTRLSGSQPIFF